MPVAWALSLQSASTGVDLQDDGLANAVAPGQTWLLQRRCALSPSQFGACFAGLAVASGLVAAFFWAMGARWITAFAGLEVLLVGVAFAWHALHAADGEQLSVAGRQLRIERRVGLRVWLEQVPLPGLRVTAQADGSIGLSLRGRHWILGRNATDAARRQVLAELRRAVAAAQG